MGRSGPGRELKIKYSYLFLHSIKLYKGSLRIVCVFARWGKISGNSDMGRSRPGRELEKYIHHTAIYFYILYNYTNFHCDRLIRFCYFGKIIKKLWRGLERAGPGLKNHMHLIIFTIYTVFWSILWTVELKASYILISASFIIKKSK